MITNVTTGVSSTSDGQHYAGPVAGLTDELIIATSDKINVTANIPNVFIHTGSGDDALNVSSASGNNVLDGGTGSNFLVGGNGMDTFFVDDRVAPADIWSTVVGFGAGDAATIWGVTPQDFDLAWVDGQGAAGYTGLTLHATAAGKPTASLTLAGYSQADLNNNRLSVHVWHRPRQRQRLHVCAREQLNLNVSENMRLKATATAPNKIEEGSQSRSWMSAGRLRRYGRRAHGRDGTASPIAVCVWRYETIMFLSRLWPYMTPSSSSRNLFYQFPTDRCSERHEVIGDVQDRR